MCKISIIVPLYNGKKTIGRCLDSLVNQTLHDIEILVINDGSQDGGEKIAAQYMQRDKRIRLISQENAGLGAARNHGIREAAGEFVGFVDCDDFVDVNMYKVMTDALEKVEASVGVCQEKNVYAESGKIKFINETRFPVKNEAVYPSEKVLDWYLNFSYLSLNSMCYKVVRTSLFKEHGIKVPENYRHAEDLVTSAALFSVVKKVVIIPQSLYYYVHTKKSISYNYSLQHAIDVYYDWWEVKGYIEKSEYPGSIDNFSLGMRFSSLKQLHWAKDKQEKVCPQAKKLEKIWEKERKINSWRPDFKAEYIPAAHKIKICVSYFRMERLVCFLIKKLSWIPFFIFLT